MPSETSKSSVQNSPFSRGAMYEKLVGETSTRLSATALSHLPLSSYTSDSHVLDSACGPGIASKLLLSPPPPYVAVAGLPLLPAPRVTAIDLSEDMVSQYRANAAALGWTTATAHVQDSQDLSRFADSSFDAVVMGLGIFALSDAVAGVAEMRRVLRPGGYALVTTWKTRRPQDLMSRAARAIRPDSDGATAMDLDPRWLTSEHLAAVMKAGGFKVENVQLREASPDWRLGSLRELLEALSAPMWTGMFCKGWSEEQRGRWAGEIEKLLTEEEKETARLEMVAHICISQKEY